jgi:hypothetical protein
MTDAAGGRTPVPPLSEKNILSTVDYADNSEWLKKEAYKIAKEKALRGAALVQGDKFDVMRQLSKAGIGERELED